MFELLKKFVRSELKVDYLVTGSWSLKASQEAERLLGTEHINKVTDAREANGGKFGKIPDESTWKLSKASALIYYCDNETVDGVEFPRFPKILGPKPGEEEPIVIADMSTTGITIIIIKESLLPPSLPTTPPTLLRQLGLPIGPIVLEYTTIAKNNSFYNTVSIFDVYVAGLVLKSLLNNKVDGQLALAKKKAAIIYAMLESHPNFYEVRSKQ